MATDTQKQTETAIIIANEDTKLIQKDNDIDNDNDEWSRSYDIKFDYYEGHEQEDTKQEEKDNDNDEWSRSYDIKFDYYENESDLQEDTEQDQNESESSDNNALAPKCFCGEIMLKTESSSLKMCLGCTFRFDKNSTDKCYSCPKHEGYQLCVTCAEFVQNCNDDPIEDIHHPHKLYYIYNGNKIHGPMTMRDIITYYVTKKIKTTKMYVMKADTDDEWTKLEFPNEILDMICSRDDNKKSFMTECEKINCEIKKKHPDLYARLIEHILCSKLRRVIAPKEMPKDEQIMSELYLTQILGKILSIFLAAILIIHTVPTVIIICIILCVFWCCDKINGVKCAVDRYHKYGDVIGVAIAYSGVIITPILVVHFMLNKSDLYDEIQSWMVSYIVWGASSYLTSIMYFTLHRFFIKGKGALNSVILMIIGVKINNNDHFIKNTTTFLGVVFVFSALAALLPAAIAGFIANFALEEKFELKCGANITSDICFESDYGCCDVVSSHDYRNSYAFIGGLASNILATWAVIRICGYL
eukprot:264229_1